MNNSTYEKILKDTKGITLIALIITIIIMIILAGITINMLLGANGLFAKIEKAKIEKTRSDLEETFRLAYSEESLATDGGTKTLAEFVDLLNEKGYNISETESEYRFEHKGYEFAVLYRDDMVCVDYKGTKEAANDNGHNWVRNTDTDVITCSHCGLSFKIGDVIEYTSDGASSTVLQKEYTGYTDNQTINRETGVTWVVLGVADEDNDGKNEKLLITTQEPVNDDYDYSIRFDGAETYAYGESKLNEVCNTLYSNSNYGEARSMNMQDAYNLFLYANPAKSMYYDGTNYVKNNNEITIGDFESINSDYYNSLIGTGTYVPYLNNGNLVKGEDLAKLRETKINSCGYTLSGNSLTENVDVNPSSIDNIPNNRINIIFGNDPENSPFGYYIATKAAIIWDDATIGWGIGGVFSNCIGTDSTNYYNDNSTTHDNYDYYASNGLRPVVALREIPGIELEAIKIEISDEWNRIVGTPKTTEEYAEEIQNDLDDSTVEINENDTIIVHYKDIVGTIKKQTSEITYEKEYGYTNRNIYEYNEYNDYIELSGIKKEYYGTAWKTVGNTVGSHADGAFDISGNSLETTTQQPYEGENGCNFVDPTGSHQLTSKSTWQYDIYGDDPYNGPCYYLHQRDYNTINVTNSWGNIVAGKDYANEANAYNVGKVSLQLPSKINNKNVTKIYLPSICIGMQNIYSVTIPSTATFVSFYFGGSESPSLTTIRFLGTTPPTIEDAHTLTPSVTKIYVPSAAVNAYKDAMPEVSYKVIGY